MIMRKRIVATLATMAAVATLSLATAGAAAADTVDVSLCDGMASAEAASFKVLRPVAIVPSVITERGYSCAGVRVP